MNIYCFNTSKSVTEGHAGIIPLILQSCWFTPGWMKMWLNPPICNSQVEILNDYNSNATLSFTELKKSLYLTLDSLLSLKLSRTANVIYLLIPAQVSCCVSYDVEIHGAIVKCRHLRALSVNTKSKNPLLQSPWGNNPSNPPPRNTRLIPSVVFLSTSKAAFTSKRVKS